MKKVKKANYKSRLKELIGKLSDVSNRKLALIAEESILRADILALMKQNKLASANVKDLGIEVKMVVAEQFKFDVRKILEALDFDYAIDKGLVKCDTKVCRRELKDNPAINTMRQKVAETEMVRIIRKKEASPAG